jgi:hypothetical protein
MITNTFICIKALLIIKEKYINNEDSENISYVIIYLNRIHGLYLPI